MITLGPRHQKLSAAQLKELLTTEQRAQLDLKGFTFVFLNGYPAKVTQEDLLNEVKKP